MSQMDQKQRLIDLLTMAPEIMDCPQPHEVAAFLLSQGVIVPPCKIGTHLWKVTYPYRQEPKVTEFVVKNFKTVGKRHKIQVEVQAVNVPVTNWMYYTAFHETKEEAERELAERRI